MDLASSSVRFSASVELMSGLRVPARTAMPMLDRPQRDLAASPNSSVLDQLFERGVVHNYNVNAFTSLQPIRDEVRASSHGRR